MVVVSEHPPEQPDPPSVSQLVQWEPLLIFCQFYCIRPIAPPQLEVKTLDPLVYSVVVPVPPTIESGDYKKLRVPVPGPSYTEDAIESVLDNLRNQYASFEPEDKEIASGDMAVIDLSSTAGGEPLINQEEAQYQVFADATTPLPGFAAELLGLKTGAVKEFKLTLPDDFGDADKAGREAEFKVTVKEVKRQVLPELNDAFAKRIDQVEPKLETIKELRQRVTKDLKERAAERDKSDYREMVLDAAVAGATIEFPPVMAESEMHGMVEEQMRQFGLSDNKEQFLKMMGKTEEELNVEIKPMAQKRVARALLIGSIAQAEKVTAAEADMQAEIEGYTGNAAEEQKAEIVEMLSRPDNRARLTDMIVSRKTVELLEKLARRKPTAKKAKAGAEDATEKT